MDKIIMRKAISLDMADINQLQLDIFKGEQKIPAEMIPLSTDNAPQWWCVLYGSTIIGTVAAWKDKHQMHWGRFAVNPQYRGLHIGTKLARFSLEDLFNQGIEEIYMDARETTVKIICRMGGKIIGSPVPFYDGTVTPVVLYHKNYIEK